MAPNDIERPAPHIRPELDIGFRVSGQSVEIFEIRPRHGWSRNPIYVGMLLLYAGIGMGASSAWALILALPLVVILRYRVVAREETYLEGRFGNAYRDYKARVRRWL